MDFLLRQGLRPGYGDRLSHCQGSRSAALTVEEYMIRKGQRPQFSVGFDRSDGQERYRKVFSFRKSWVAIAVVLVFDLVFLIPTYTTLLEALELWRAPDDLFNLVAALFITFWLMGWSMAPLLITSVLAVMLFGREVVRVRPGVLEVFLGLPFFGVTAQYDMSRMRNLRIEYPDKKSGRSWRGSHVAFDYGANTAAFGSEVQESQVDPLRASLEMAAGTTIRNGEASALELEGDWSSGVAQALLTRGKPTTPVTGPLASVGEDISLASPSTLALIAANAVPLFGAAFWGWDLGAVMVLYWAESAIIGFFNLAKIIVIGRWQALFLGPFFLGHFGGFMAAHFMFLYTLFIEKPAGDAADSGDLHDVALLFISLWPALAVLFLSHAFSFFKNFLGRREYEGRTMKTQMSEPYSRIVFMHLVLIFGGGLSLMLGGATPVLVIVILVKIVVDVRAHLKQRKEQEKVTSPAPE